MESPPSTLPPDPAILDEIHFQRLLRRSSWVVGLSLGIPLVVLLALVLYLLRAAGWVDHTDRVIAQAHSIEKELVVIQTGFRAWRLSGDASYLKSYGEGASPAGIPAGLENLHRLVTDNPRQSAELEKLRGEVQAWFDFVEQEKEAVRADPSLMHNPEFLKRGGPLFATSQNRLSAFTHEEMRLRDERARILQVVVITVMAGFALAALAGIPAISLWLGRLLKQVNHSYATSLRAADQRTEELQVTLSSIGDAVVATDAGGCVEFLNPVAQEMMGWTQREAHGKPLEEVFEIYNEQTGEKAENPVGRVLRENIVVGLANHTVLHSRDGRIIPIEDSAAPIRGEDGRVRGVILVFHDVTEKHQSADQLKASESRLAFLNNLGETTRLLPTTAAIREVCVQLLGRFLRVSRCAFATVEPETGRFSILNDYTDGCASTVGDYDLALFGPRAEAKMLGGRTLVIRHVHGEIGDEEGGAMFQAIGIQAIICCPLLKNGQLRAMMAVHQTAPRVWTEAEVQLVETVVERCWSLLERKNAEMQLVAATERAEQAALAVADAAERFRLLGEVVSLQVWTANPEGGLDYVNQECLKYFGETDEREVLGDGWTKFVHPEDLPPAAARWKQSLETGERYTVEFRLRSRADGHYRWFLVRAEAMRDKHGRLVKWFGTNTAIHELKTAQSNAERANRAKDDFLAALSHELRTPLTPVLMTAAALREDERLPPDAREQLGMMERNIALEARLIDDLLDLTSISRGKLQLRAERCDAHSLIGLAVEIVRSEAQAKGLVLECDFSAARSGLMADPARFQQVIWNLLRNAVKFTPHNGRIHIRTRDEMAREGSTWLKIEISDTGIGIDEDSLEEIFLPFEQAAATGDHRFGGVGLGLSIAKAIVSLHGGQIRAQSEGPQRGATFTVEFPGATDPPAGLVDMSPTDSRTQGPSSAPADGSKPPSLRLLLVEDHAATLQALSTLLTRAGHHVVTATHLAEAYLEAERNTFDFVISDLGLPDGTGSQLMEKLRDRYQLRGIALSGYGMDEDIARCREAGFVAHLVKPVRFADLSRVLDKLTRPAEAATPPLPDA